MLKLGEKIISDIYLGDKKIAKVFLGDKLVYQANKPIFLDYVHFDGNSYINTGIALQTCTIETAVKYESGHSQRMLNGWVGDYGLYWGMQTNGSFELAGSSLSQTTNLTDYTVVKIKYDLTTNVVTPTVDDVTQSFNITVTNTKPYTIGCSTPTSPNKVIGNVYYHRFTNADGELIQDLRPCIDPKGTVCMYDMVTKKYFYNQGTGTLTAGNVIKFVDYIITDGSSYIDTEYCPNENTYIEYTFEIVKAPPTAWNGLFGSRQDTAYYAYNILCRSSLSLRLDYGRYEENSYQTSLNTKYTIKAGLGEIYINDELVKSYTPQRQGTSPYSMYLGNFNNKGTPYATGTAQNIYPCKIKENNVLVRDLRPCVSNGVVGFYDMATGKIFTNAGTGTLKASGRFVESIIFDGASYIDTGIQYQTCTVKTETKFSLTDTRQLMGFSGSSPIHYWGCNTNGYLDPLTSVSGLEFNEIEIAYNKDDVDNKTLTMTANGKSVVKTGKVDTTKSYLIGCLDTSSYFAQVEVKYNEIYVNGEVVQDLRPYVDENNVACFKDIVTGNLFYNQGTGTLGYTE